jgi:rhodanese-related sulfurtransferase
MSIRFARVVILVLAGVALGLAWNRWSGRGIELHANALIQPGEPSEIQPAEAKERLAKGALFLDARAPLYYKRGHIPDALLLPEEEFDAAFHRLEARLKDSLDIVVYCSGFGCEASHIVARRLREKGLPAVVLHEGWPAWQDAGYPTKEGEEP